MEKHLAQLPTLNERYRNIKLLIEDYKKINREFALLGFSDGQEVVIPGIIEILQMAHGTHFGVAVQGKVYPADDNDLIENFSELIKKIGFAGIFDIDFYESDGLIYFAEINMRFGGSGYAYTKTGVNLPVMMIKSFLGENNDGMNKKIVQGATFFNERMALDDWYNGYMTTKDFMRLKKSSQINFINDESDSQPQKIFMREFIKKYFKRFARQLFGR